MEKTTSVSQKGSQTLTRISFQHLWKYLGSKTCSNERTDSLNCLTENFSSLVCVEDDISHSNLFLKDATTIDRMMAALFYDQNPGMDFYAIAAPLSHNIVHSSARYKNIDATTDFSQRSAANILQANLELTYQLVLQKFYELPATINRTILQEVSDKKSGLKKFLELDMSVNFLEATANKDLPDLDMDVLSQTFSQLKVNNSLKQLLPLSLFNFEGIVVITVRDVTVRECCNRIKNIMLSMPYPGDMKSFSDLGDNIQNLIELPQAGILLTSLDRDNISINPTPALDPLTQPRPDSANWQQLKQVFKTQDSLLIPVFTKSLLSQFPFLSEYESAGIKSIGLLPLKINEQVIGVVVITANAPGVILQHHLNKMEPVIPLLVIALEKQSGKLNDEIDKVIKEQFTAVQSSVNWKFTEAARNYIDQKNKGLDSEIESIIFENVFPLYGSIDVRNSSIERSTAIQKDLLEQLQMADAIIKKAKKEIYLFSLQEVGFRIDKYMDIASLILFPGDELAIQNFLDEEITALFNHLRLAAPAISNDIDNYFFLLNTNTNKISNQCAAFEKSISMINNELVKFVNNEQAKVQEIYAHYFEYFVTDGIDFNIYIGQSITPNKPFDQFYLKNLKLWQLTTLVKAAKKVRDLHGRMPVSLDTTQLILAHSKPLSISFRVAERKFDVDGAYNIHYEIIKKRIDKVKIMGTCERLTQPGKIAIVFAHDKEAQEYISYINYLQKEGLLEDNIEYCDLEELPGVRGLRALRVSIKMDSAEEQLPLLLNQQLKRVV